MNTFNKKSLYAAIAGLGALGVAGTADAVYVNPDGLGQVVLYPYYTTRARPAGGPFAGAQFNTLISVVNSTASAKAVKVRFLENLNSREVLDFNLYLSHNDVWTAGIVPTDQGAGMVTYDKSCTDPGLTPGTVYPFVSTLFTDGADTSLDRTREGYIEIIEMGDVTTPAFVAAITHKAGVPTCTGISALVASDTTVGSGGLFGDLTIINVNATAETSIAATALANFNTAASLWAPAGTINPQLSSGNVTTSESFKGGAAVSASWTRSIDAVSASMMHDTVMNEYILDSGTQSLTDWVVTYPTKRYYYAADGTLTGSGLGPPPQLFQRNFVIPGGACDDVGIQFWDREESIPGGPLPTFSPPSPGSPPSALCWEANIVTFNNSNVFSSPYSRNINVGANQNGWMRLNLVGGVATPGVHQLVSVGGQTFNGLPVIGFSTSTFYNGQLSTSTAGTVTQSAYGGSYAHKYTSN
jgi:hypothetical protein